MVANRNSLPSFCVIKTDYLPVFASSSATFRATTGRVARPAAVHARSARLARSALVEARPARLARSTLVEARSARLARSALVEARPAIASVIARAAGSRPIIVRAVGATISSITVE